MTYRVWISIEKDDDGEDVGLPDPVTEPLGTLVEAQAVVRSVLEKFNPTVLNSSDHREGGIVEEE